MAHSMPSGGGIHRISSDEGFSGDGMCSLGNDTLIIGNLVKDHVQVDGNHPDGFQSWSRGPDGAMGKGVVRGLVIENNTLLEWTGPADNPVRGDLQGIGMFDGMFEDLVIQNNLIVVSAYHGIAVAGVRGAKIVNNTLLNPRRPGVRYPWITVTGHKNGTPSERVLIANNIVPWLTFHGKRPDWVTLEDNLLTTYPAAVLVGPYQGDFHPLQGGAAIGGGDATAAPPHRHSGQAPPGWNCPGHRSLPRELNTRVPLAGFSPRPALLPKGPLHEEPGVRVGGPGGLPKADPSPRNP